MKRKGTNHKAYLYGKTLRGMVGVLCVVLCLVALGGMLFSGSFGQGVKKSFAAEEQKKDSKAKTVASKDDLEGARIGVQLGTTGDIYCSDYEGDKAGTQVERFNKGPDAVAALRQGKIDAVVIDEQPAKAYIKNNSDLMILNEEFTIEDYAGVIAKENTELLEKANAAIQKLKEAGTLDQIIDSYINGKGDFHYVQKVKKGKHLIMATNATFPPYEFYEDNKIVGIDVEIAKAVADELGMVLEIQDMEFDAIINAVSSGKADIGLSGFTVTEDRKKQINFTESYTTSKQVIIVKSENAAKKQTFRDRLYDNFVKQARWKYIVKGLINTILITIFAILIGYVLGFVLAIIRVAYDRGETGRGPVKVLCVVLNFIAKVYVTVIRGTPVMVQLLIIYYVIFSSVNINKLFVAVIAFGLNSAAYVCEVVRSGIMAIDQGQFEAANSLGLKYPTIMMSIVLPQAFKNVLPALANEFISLLKETSISGYIGLLDLTRGGDIIRSVTYEAMLPLLAVALIYLIIVVGLSGLVTGLERRLKKNER